MPTVNVYQPGDTVKIDFDFENEDHIPADPPVVRGKFRTNTRDLTTYEFGVDAELIQLGVGSYRFVISVPDAPGVTGMWRYRLEGEDLLGNSLAAYEWKFRVQSSEFL